MRISHDKKFIFLSLPRSASLTIRKVLDPYSDIKSRDLSGVSEEFPFWHHLRAKKLKKVFEKRGWKWSEYRKFCLVRDPFDRVISAYKMRWEKMFGWHWSGRPLRDVKSYLHDLLRGRPTFEEYTERIDPSSGFAISINHFAYDDNGNRLLDNILKFEKLPNNVIRYMKSVLGVEVDGLPHYHNSKRKRKLREWYTSRSIKNVKSKFGFEIEEFGYDEPVL